MAYPSALLALAIFVSAALCAQPPVLALQLPDVSITADQVLRGDADTYGLGNWRCTFHLSWDGSEAVLEGYIIFRESANDSTIIRGRVLHRIALPELAPYGLCTLTFDRAYGAVGGPNIGARGARWYAGRGLIRKALIVTDTFGDDVGRIGGLVQFRPVQIRLDCLYAALNLTY